MNCRRQALWFCLDPAIVVVVRILNELLLEVFHGAELLQIQQLTFEQPEEIFYHSIIQTVSLVAHALANTFLLEHLLVLFVLLLPVLVGMENRVCSGRDLCKRLVQHGGSHAEYRTIRYGVTDQIAAVQIENWGQIEFFSEQAKLRLTKVCQPMLSIRCTPTFFGKAWRHLGSRTNVQLKFLDKLS